MVLLIFDQLVDFSAVVLSLGLIWYIVFMVYRYKKEKLKILAGATGSGSQKEFNEFKERTEKRLRALEEIVVEDDQIDSDKIDFEPDNEHYGRDKSRKSSQTGSKSKLKNQLKS